jgi:glycosyltransferase involved in cell wall biosynthesis
MTDTPLASRRIAMFVLNPCTHDARVLRAASACAEAGASVRIFATADDANAPDIVSPSAGVEIQRLDVRSWPQRVRGLVPQAEIANRSTGEHSTSNATPKRRAVSLAKAAIRPIHLPTLYFDFGRVAAPAAVDWHADTLWAHDLSGLHPTMRARRSLPDAAVIYDSHELWTHRNASPGAIVEALDRRNERRWIGQADLVITVSPSIAEWLERTYALADRPTVVRNIPNDGADTSAHSVREMAGLDDSAHIILYTGRVTTGRGLRDLASVLPEFDADTHVVLLGYDPQGLLGELRSIAGEAGDRMHLVGPVPSDEVVAAARSADVAFVGIEPTCLSYEYSLPNKLFEAMQAGLAIVASDLPDIASLVDPISTARLFDPGDWASLHRALSVSMQQERQRIVANERLEKPSWTSERQELIDSVASTTDQPSNHASA